MEINKEGKEVKIVCISTAHTKLAKDQSTSVKVCGLVKELINKEGTGKVDVEIIALKDYEIRPCSLCGGCYESGRCVCDDEINRLLSQIETAQGLFLVVPHYSPIPSKLIMLFEKINEISYAGWINDDKYQSPFYNMPVGIIGHGGMAESEKVLKYYHDHLVTPVANTLKSLSFKVISMDHDFRNGVCFGLKDDNCIKKVPDSIFPQIIQDWPGIEERLSPFVKKGLTEMM